MIQRKVGRNLPDWSDYKHATLELRLKNRIRAIEQLALSPTTKDKNALYEIANLGRHLQYQLNNSGSPGALLTQNIEDFISATRVPAGLSGESSDDVIKKFLLLPYDQLTTS